MSPTPRKNTLKEKHPEWTGYDWHVYIELRDMLKKELDIRQVAAVMGGVDRQDGDPTKWKLPNGSNFWFKPNTQGWKDLNQDQGGQGAVALVAHTLDDINDEEEAVLWLKERFVGPNGKLIEGVSVDPATTFVASEKAPFMAPINHSLYIDEVADYLIGERGIPPSLIREEIAAGRLYATRRDVSLKENAPEEFDDEGNLIERQVASNQRGMGDYKTHCVFVSRTAGELRCVEKNGFKGTAPGSQSDSSGYNLPHQKTVAERLICLTEAAVDAQAYRALFPGRYVISTNGAYRFGLHFSQALEALTRDGFGLRLGFDADNAGDQAAQKVFNAFYASKALAHHYRDHPMKLSEEDFEDWFLDGSLSPDVDLSPHTLFFGNGTGFVGNLPVHAKRVESWTDGDGKKHITTHWDPTGEVSNPLVVVRVQKPVGPFTQDDVGKTLRFRVSAKMYAYVVNDLDIRRDRPMHAKDWDDELLRLGVAYVRDYERCANEGWKTVPALPAPLAALRNRAPIELTPLPPPPAPATPPAPAAASVATPVAAAPTPAPAPAAPTPSPDAGRRFQRSSAPVAAPAPAPESEARPTERRFRRSHSP